MAYWMNLPLVRMSESTLKNFYMTSISNWCAKLKNTDSTGTYGVFDGCILKSNSFFNTKNSHFRAIRQFLPPIKTRGKLATGCRFIDRVPGIAPSNLEKKKKAEMYITPRPLFSAAARAQQMNERLVDSDPVMRQTCQFEQGLLLSHQFWVVGVLNQACYGRRQSSSGL